jgi:TatD DNase family protein
VFPLVDIGANLTNASFSHDLEAVLQRARAAGVDQIVVTGTSLAGSRAAGELAARHGLHATAGIHPHHAQDFSAETLPDLEALLGDPTYVAVGECGLDYNRMFSPRQAQLLCLEAQLDLAARTGKPLFLHERDASDDLLATLRPRRATLGPAAVHCFTGDGATLDAYLDLGLFIGITGWICDERRGLHLRDLVPRIPPDRLMLETDAPYLLPRNLPAAVVKSSNRRNEPGFLPAVLEVVASAQRRTPAEVAAATTATARRFFGL